MKSFVNLESATSPNVMDDIGEDCVNLESATSPEIMDDIGEDCIKLESAENINDISPVPNSILLFPSYIIIKQKEIIFAT